MNRIGAIGASLLLAACDVGTGSDIGPRLPFLPNASCKCVVLDDGGRAVSGAVVEVGNARAVTGRNGRGELFAEPRGRVLVRVDGTNGAAVAGDLLAAYTVAMSVTGRDLPAVLHVPDLSASGAATLSLGTQVAPVSVASAGGAVLTVGAATTVGAPAGVANVVVRLGDLPAVRLPGELPPPPAGALLVGQAVLVSPPDVWFTPGASIETADDLALGAGTAKLFFLDPETGEWTAVLGGGIAAGGRIVSNGAVSRSGIYVFAAEVAAATVTGRVVDAAGRPVPDVLVRVDHLATQSRGDGSFAVSGVPAVQADGSGRQTTVELFAGGEWLPARASRQFAVAPGIVALGDLALDTIATVNVRVQQVTLGRADAIRPVRLSTLEGAYAMATTSDAEGQSLFEDVPVGWFGFQAGRAIDGREVLYGQSVRFLARSPRWQDTFQFLARRPWYVGARASRVVVTDAIGGGPLFGAAVVQGAIPGINFVGTTREGGTVFVTRDFAGRATASLRSERDGQVVVSAFSIMVPDGDHLELPLHRVRRVPFGAFDRHGLVGGTVLGADPARDHELRATRRQSLQEWWDDIAEGIDLAASLPVDVDVAATHGAFRVGVPVAGGHLAVAETTTGGAGKTLQRFGVAADFVPVEGTLRSRDIELSAAGSTGFVVAGALAGAPPELDPAQWSLALALQQPSGRIVEVVRGLRGNHAAVGDDLVFTLPALAGAFVDHGWLALLDGSWPGAAGEVLRCSALVSLPRPSSLPAFPRGLVRFPAFPELHAPAPSAAVPAAGFTVEFALPPGALYGTIELRSDSPGEARSWQVVVPAFATGFPFVTLPAQAPSPLVAGRTWTLTLSAWFGDGPVAQSERPYRDLSTFLQSIGSIERGGWLVLRRSIEITTN